MKTISIKWLQALDTDEVDETIEEACVDCYDEEEQCSALVEMAGQELAFPFPGTVMGEAVEVVDTAPSKYDPLGWIWWLFTRANSTPSPPIPSNW